MAELDRVTVIECFYFYDNEKEFRFIPREKMKRSSKNEKGDMKPERMKKVIRP